MTPTKEQLEAIADAIDDAAIGCLQLDEHSDARDIQVAEALAAWSIIAPIVRDAALDEAAAICDGWSETEELCEGNSQQAAEDIRALKAKP